MPRLAEKKRLILATVAVAAVAAAYVAFAALPRHRIKRNVERVRMDMRALHTAIEAYFADWCIYPAFGIGHPGPGNIRSYNHFVTAGRGSRSGVVDFPTFLMCDWSEGEGQFSTIIKSRGGGCKSGFPMPVDGASSATQTPTTNTTRQCNEPYAYMDSYPVDPFCDDRGATFVYWSVFPGDPATLAPGRWIGWILISPGPDGDYDIGDCYYIYDSGIPQPSKNLLAGTNPMGSAFTYDPTNGLVSDGDIWRVKM